MAIKKKNFQDIVKRYCEGRKRFGSIKIGDLIWEVVPRGIADSDYHPAVVRRINIDECFVDVIDVTMDNKEKRYSSFLTESELLGEPGMSREIIEKEYLKYADAINEVIKNAS